MGKKETKTNAIRILETMKIPYEARTYECDDFVDAAQIADKLGLDQHADHARRIDDRRQKRRILCVCGTDR